MTDDIIFCAKTGRQIVQPSSAAGSNIIPFPRRATDKPRPERLQGYEKRESIHCSATLEDIENAAHAEGAALSHRFQDNDI